MQTIFFPDNCPRLDLGNIEKRRNTLEFKTIMFTVVLYFFVCFGLLGVHYMGPYLPKAPALIEAEAEAEANKAAGITEGGRNIHESSSGSPHNPHLHRKKSGNTESTNTEKTE